MARDGPERLFGIMGYTFHAHSIGYAHMQYDVGSWSIHGRFCALEMPSY